MHRWFNIGQGIERLTIFLFSFFFMCHLCSCFWITIASFSDDAIKNKFSGTWLEPFYGEKTQRLDIYLVSLYWTVTTITTVGYGDISGTNLPEMIFCCLVMIIGVIAFGFG